MAKYGKKASEKEMKSLVGDWEGKYNDTIQDADHFKQEWTSRSKGKEETGVFLYTRKK